MKLKQFTIRYYLPRVGADGKGGKVSALLDGIDGDTAKLGRVQQLTNGDPRQIRLVNVSQDRTIYQGRFVRFREEMPTVGSVNSAEEVPLELEDGEELLENNFFCLFLVAGRELLAYQQTANAMGLTTAALAGYLSFLSKRTVSLDDVLTLDALSYVEGGGLIKSVEFSVAKPKSVHYAPDPHDTWTKNAFEYMEGTGSRTVSTKLTTRAKEGLYGKVIGQVKLLLQSPQTKKLKVKLSDIDEPIDLLADRIFDKIKVQMDKGAVNSQQMFTEIIAARAKNKDLAAYLATGDEALDID